MSNDDADLAQELVRLASADNFRDVAGPGYGTTDGGRVRRGVFYRSNELQLSEADAASVAGLGVTGVLDLRGDDEIAHHPDAAVPGASWHHFDVLGIPMSEVSDLADRAAAVAVMERVYRGFVENDGARAAFGALLTHLAEADGPQVFHCTAGKDRTGWASVLLLHLARVADDVILADYLLTNTVSSATREKYLAMVEEHLGPDKVDVYERVMVADAHYLATAYAAVAASYGSVAGYLTQGLGLGQDTLDVLARKLRG